MSRGNKSFEVFIRDASGTTIGTSYTVLDAVVAEDVSRIVITADAMTAGAILTIGLGISAAETDLLSFGVPISTADPVTFQFDVMIPKGSRLAIKSRTAQTAGFLHITYLN